jgi:DNA-binding NarL/FixJ family response regulator
MSKSVIEKNKLENIDLVQIEYFSDLPISNKNIIVIEPNNPIAITIRKFLVKLGFENIYVCGETSDCVKIFADFINNEINVPVIIDDSISYGSIRNITSEIFEMQPNAKIIIITAKEKNDSQTIELLRAGIVSIIQEPLNFQDFKKTFSSIFEKEDNIIEFESEENLQSLLSSSNRISQNKIQDILRVGSPKIEEMIKKEINKRNIILEGDVLEATCNQCSSTNITYISECPNCKGINFRQQNLIEHYNCGEVFPKEADNNICPKCNKNIGSVGTDYREFSDYYVCSSCNDRFPKPLLRFHCLDCGNFFIEKLASWKKGRIYKIQK